MRAVNCVGLFSGFCYTQFADTYQEVNGLLPEDRRPKFPLARTVRAVRADHPTAIPFALASVAPRMGPLRHASSGPDLSSAGGVQPARANDRCRTSHRSAG